MTVIQLAAFVGLVAAVIVMLIVTQTKVRVTWPAWLIPATAGVALAAWTIVAMAGEGLTSFWALYTSSLWGLQLWYDRLMSVAAAFFLLQNRARAAGMKSEVWVLLVIFTGSMGLLLMLALTVYLERKQEARPAPGSTRAEDPSQAHDVVTFVKDLGRRGGGSELGSLD